jgi:hypothetical protein
MNYVVVNKHRVRSNKNTGMNEPVFRVSKGKHGKPYYAREVQFPAEARLVYDPEHPMPCGASVWIEAPHMVVELADEDVIDPA